MLKIVKGLNPHIDKDNEDGISIYTDSKGDEYVRVKFNDKDFCIAAYDYVKHGKDKFTWDEAMKSLEDDGLTTFAKEQLHLCINHRDEINNRLEEIGEVFKKEWYWTIDEYNIKCAWSFYIKNGNVTDLNKENHFMIRPVLNL